MSIEQQCQSLSQVSERYQQYESYINKTLLEELASLAGAFKRDAEFAQNENRLLRIGIIGQVKRGKSSFLNSLLFNGESILPKAATPMTAALTKINYAQSPSATVEFYSEKEWQKVLAKAELVKKQEAEYLTELDAFKSAREKGVQASIRPPIKPIVSDEEKACVDLYDMVKSNNIDIQALLGTTKKLDGITNNKDLINKLNEYVGANGKFTPIVKSTELALNIEALKGIEVVDTPGMNDPIISRGRRTQEFIGQCDVIFYLSLCGHFFDMHDMRLLAQNIPDKGIKDIVLIGSLFDSALRDVYHNYASIQQAIPDLIQKLNEQAQTNVDDICQKDTMQNGQSGLMQAFKKALPPIFISSRCFDLGTKDLSTLNNDEKDALAFMNNMFEGFTFTQPLLKSLANFSKVEEKVQAVRKDKDIILAERFENIFAGSERGIKNKLQQIQEDVEQKRINLLEGDLDTITKNQQTLVQRIESGKAKINNIFEKYSIQAEKKLARIQNEIRQDALQTKQIESQTSSRTVSESVWAGTERCGFLWLDKRDVYRTETRIVNYTYANVHDAISKLEEFVVSTSKELFTVSEEAINLQLFRQDIKDSIKGMFDFSDDDFDPDMILMPLSNAVERITIPHINLDMDKHINTIREQFTTSEVEGDEMAQLRTEQGRIVSLLLTEIDKELIKSIDNIVSKLDKERVEFIPSLTKDLEKNVEQLKRDLAQKEQSLSGYTQVLQQLSEDLI